MPEKISGWPEGTQKIEYPNGKKEIILPKSTDMNKYSRTELATKVKLKQLTKKEKTIEPIMPQSSIEREGVSPSLWSDKIYRSKKVHRRQEQIRQDRNKEIKFSTVQKENAAENYQNIWER